MGRKKKNATGDLLEQMKNAVRQDVLASLGPALSRLQAAVNDLEAALSGKGAGKRRGRKPGPKPGKKKGRKAGRPKKGKRTPRGALKAEVDKILRAAAGPINLAKIRDKVMRKSLFKARDPKIMYAQIVHTVQNLDNVVKTGRGLYAIKKK